MLPLAAIDIGSNSVRLKIARLVRHKLVTLADEREVTRLGTSVFNTGMLDAVAMAQTVEVLKSYKKTIQKYGAGMVRAVATSALRDARNGSVFREWIFNETGIRVEVISGLEEARLIHLGISSQLGLGSGPSLLIDLGGGSCELTVSSGGNIHRTYSLPLGAVRLTEEFLLHDPPAKKEIRQLVAFIDEELERPARRIAGYKLTRALATSGTAAALSAVCSGKPRRSGPVPGDQVEKIFRKLLKMRERDRRKLEGIGPRRAEIIVAGAAVFTRLTEKCNLASFQYCPLGLRDGLLAQMAAEFDELSPSRRQIQSDRSFSLSHAMRRFQVDVDFATEVRRLATELFQRLQRLHSLPPEYSQWLAAAAMLHEAGACVNRNGWQRHSYYIIAHSDFLGYTPYERLLIASLARYLGSARPSSGHKTMKLLNTADQKLIPRAVVLLRLARALNQTRTGMVRELAVRISSEKVQIGLRTRRGRVDLELWAAAKEAGYFRGIFGRELVVTEA